LTLARRQLIDGKNKLDDFKNGFVNLALPFFGFSEPVAAAKNKYGSTEWTLWDRFSFENDPPLREIIGWFREKHGLDIAMVSQGVSMLWSSFIGKKKSEERLPLPFSQLVEHVSKRPVPAHQRHFIVEIIAADDDGEDVEVRWPCCSLACWARWADSPSSQVPFIVVRK
jgi:ubiquitin-activating enzyme E1